MSQQKPEGTTEPHKSSLSDDILKYRADPFENKAFAPTDEDIQNLQIYQDACNYIAVASIFLTWAPLDAKKDLKKEHIKNRLLGHWGTGPGISLVWAHTNLLIKQTNEPFLLVTGPGHGAPGVLSGLYLEGSITRYYDQYSMKKEGLDAFCKAFSFPGGFPSHVNAETPGQIHEGGELGYALSVAYGSVMDNPELITVAIIGDGESETGPTATAWHAHKYLDPAESGAVLPVLHVNGFKISERTIPGTMDDREAVALFTGYGYQTCIVEYEDLTNVNPKSDDKLQRDFYKALRWAYAEIRAIQTAARSGKPIDKPRWPMIFLRSPKGWTAPKSLDGLPIVNSFRAHQVPLPLAKTNDEQFGMLQDWLASYKPQELFDESPEAKSVVRDAVIKILPENPALLLGQTKYANPVFEPLKRPTDWKKFAKKSGGEVSPMKAIGSYLDEIVKENPKRFRVFSPDELRSNKLDSVLNLTTRCFQWDPETAHKGGRVIEMLSEHTLQGFSQGYALTGRYSIFPSYEAFLAIVDTMILQYAKFQKVAKEVSWRNETPSLTYIETSTLWRQEHNGYSHQAPGLIDTLLTLPAHLVRVYLPPDGNCAISCIDHCLGSKGYVNLIVGSKNPGPNWLEPEEALIHCRQGASIWGRYSTDGGKEPDVVLVGIGVETTTEVVYAAKFLREKAPDLKVRVVNVVDLLVLAEPGQHPHALDEVAFNSLFTKDKPVIVNFHGYPSAVKSLLFGRSSHVARSRFSIKGYMEEGTTTTPYSMLRFNKVGRFDVAETALREAARQTSKIDLVAHSLIVECQNQNRESEKYALEHGADPDWFEGAGMLFEQ